ncbi:MAG: polysaccharide biosynthesis C-terminal domain-containing protein [Bacilli bacterium]|nr:polysaccharide biosynthesis C-terminal domain-containing protein [Bacilli bacterium]
MHIIIDARSLNQGSIGSLLLGLLENLDYQHHEYAVIGDRNLLEPLNLPCKIIHAKARPHSFFGYLNHNLAKVINDYDCYLTTNYMIPRGIKINSYFIIHDMLFTDYTRRNHRFYTDWIKRRIVKRSYRIASKIFTVSEFTKKRIENYFGTKKEITVIHPGVTKSFQQYIGEPVKRDNYLLYVGRDLPHRNLRRLITALEESKWPHDLHVVVQKKVLTFREARRFKKLEKNPHILVQYDLSDEAYVNELKHAYALVNPAFYEGFASAVLDARFTNTPLILSNIAANRELADEDEAIFFSPYRLKEMAKAVTSPVIAAPITPAMVKKYDNQKIAETISQSFDKKQHKNHDYLNFVFNVIYQILVVITPLITAPYVARILGPSNIGQFSFANTIVCYFVIAASLGFTQYAQRAIAEKKANREDQSKVFWQIVIVRLVPVALSLGILFILYACNVFGEYSSLVLIFSILVAGSAFDINFYFHGKENFFLVMIINLIIRVGFLISIFAFVRTPYDLDLYILLYSLMVFGSYLSTWIGLPFNLARVKLKNLDFKKHMKSTLALFIPVAAVSIYAILDKTLIGILVHGQTIQKIGYISVIVNISDLENGYYFQADRIIKAILSIILAFGTVMSTKNAIEYSSKRPDLIRQNVYRSFRFVFAIGVPMALGAMAVANSFVPLFFGEGYDKVALLLMIYAPVIVIAGCSNILGAQYMLPIKRDKQYAISVGIGFITNLVFNCILIPFFGSVGAIIGTLISEFAILFVEYIYLHEYLSLKEIGKLVWRYLVAGGVMLLACMLLYYLLLDEARYVNNLANLLILMGMGAAIYYVVLLALRDEYFFNYTKLILIKIGHAFKYMSHSVLSQSDTAAALLKVPSKSRNVKDTHAEVMNQGNEDGKEKE